ncbi:MAG: flagellar basal-body rod protein FlgF [Acidobacteria bacterium]|nr:flagellar basal-body rod protein FlgF [Acidobacteriota bacterium]MBI3655603.1 flagellar basal-body rod protein FlgF [Acidobacteriota bacterium]
MNSGLYTAYSGLLARHDSLTVIANNLANINTPGFKADRPFYRLYNDAMRRVGGTPLEQAINNGVALEGPATDFSGGALTHTGNDFDLAIEKGFFVVQTPNGIRYTRSGSFTIDPERRLITQSGFPVLGQNGPITVPEGQIQVDAQGAIAANGVSTDRLKLAQFKNLNSLRKEGAALFVQTDPNEAELDDAGAVVRQGYLEKANADPIRTTTEMIELLRQFQALEKSIEVLMNDVNNRVIDQVGRTVA